MRIAICDDDQAQRTYLKTLCQKYADTAGTICDIQEFASGENILAYKGIPFTLLLLDIELPSLDGIQVMKALENSEKIWRIVFVSCHQEQVFSTFGIKTLDFGIKPVTYEQLSRWLDIARRESADDILIKFEPQNKKTWLRASQIHFIQADGSYIRVHTAHSFLSVSRNIKYWEKQLAGTLLVRVHKSYLANLELIQDIRSEIILFNGEAVPVGRKYYKETINKYHAFVQKRMLARV